MNRAVTISLLILLPTLALAAPPRGSLDGVTPAGDLRGWALDPDTPSANLGIHIYADGPAGSGGRLVATGRAQQPRPDVVRALGIPGNHGFSIPLPPALVSSGRPLYAYALDSSGSGPNPLLPGSPAGGPTRPGAAPVGTAPSSATGLKRGLSWVRRNPMFISGLTVRMPPPPAGVVNEYHTRFRASAVHLWMDGMGPKVQAWRRARPSTRFVAWLTPRGLSSSTGSALGGLPGLPGRIGYQIGDEPHDMAQLQTYQRGIDLVRASDPGALIIGNFTYDSPVDQLVTHFATRMGGDVLSYDNYTRRRGAYKDLARYRDHGLRFGLPYWRYVYGYIDNRGAPAESDMRWDAFVGLTYGYTGHTWFLYQISPNTEGLRPLFFQSAGGWGVPRTGKLDVAGRINSELANLGRAITQLTSTSVGYVPGLLGIKPSHASKWRRGDGGDPYLEKVKSSNFQDLVVGTFTDSRGERYVMVQNVNHESATWPASYTKTATVKLTFDFDRATDPTLDRDAVLQLDRVTGRIEPLSLSGSGGERTLRVRLEPGNPVLFKYKTAKPFALR